MVMALLRSLEAKWALVSVKLHEAGMVPVVEHAMALLEAVVVPVVPSFETP